MDFWSKCWRVILIINLRLWIRNPLDRLPRILVLIVLVLFKSLPWIKPVIQLMLRVSGVSRLHLRLIIAVLS